MKKSLRLTEVCRRLDLQPYVLRYWLTEFPQLAGDDGGAGSGQRGFRPEDVALLERIKVLLYEEGYTIAGAKKKLDAERDRGASTLFDEPSEATSTEEAEREAPEGSNEAPQSLDSADDERIETLRQGVAAALEEARGILSVLDARR